MPRTRGAAISWLVPRLEQVLTDEVPVGEQLALFRALADSLHGLEACLSNALGEDAPLLLPLCRQLDGMIRRATQDKPQPGAVGAAIAQVKQVATQVLSGSTPIDSDKDAQKTLRALQEQARPLAAWWLKQKATDLKPLRLSRTLLWLGIEALPERNAEQITALRGLPADKLASFRERFDQGAFAELAGKVFDERGEQFEKNVRQATVQSRADIEGLLKPFADKLGEFRQRVDTLYGEEARERASLLGAVGELKTLNQDMAAQAAALAAAAPKRVASPQGLCARQRFGRHNANIG